MLLELALIILFIFRWLAIGIFVFGIIRIIVRWLKPQKKPTKYEAGWLIDIPFQMKLSAFFKTIISDWILGKTIRRQSVFRWVKHGFILLGFLGLLLFHGLPRFILLDETIVFPWATIEMRIIAHNILVIFLMIGIVMALINRVSSKEARAVTSLNNLLPLFLLLLIAISGHFAFTYEYLASTRGGFGILHSFIIFGMVAVLPYSKFVHVVAAPIIMVRDAIEERWARHYVQEITGVDEAD